MQDKGRCRWAAERANQRHTVMAKPLHCARPARAPVATDHNQRHLRNCESGKELFRSATISRVVYWFVGQGRYCCTTSFSAPTGPCCLCTAWPVVSLELTRARHMPRHGMQRCSSGATGCRCMGMPCARQSKDAHAGIGVEVNVAIPHRRLQGVTAEGHGAGVFLSAPISILTCWDVQVLMKAWA